jgi:hypothetical protein
MLVILSFLQHLEYIILYPEVLLGTTYVLTNLVRLRQVAGGLLTHSLLKLGGTGMALLLLMLSNKRTCPVLEKIPMYAGLSSAITSGNPVKQS